MNAALNPDAAIADLRARAVAALSHEATDALNAAADTLESTAARLVEAEQVIAKCDPIVDEARANLIRIEGEWGSGRSFEDLLIQRDEEATGIQESLDALNAYRAATTGADNER